MKYFNSFFLFFFFLTKLNAYQIIEATSSPNITNKLIKIAKKQKKINVQLSPGSYILDKEIILPEGSTIVGSGQGNTFIHFQGKTNAFVIEGNIPKKVLTKSCRLKDFTLIGNKFSKGSAILISNTIGNIIRDIKVQDFTQGYAITFLNKNKGWTENNLIDNVKIDNCKIAINFTQHKKLSGKPSVGYNKLNNVSLSLYQNQIGLKVGTKQNNNCNLYHGLINLNICLTYKTSIAMNLHLILRH